MSGLTIGRLARRAGVAVETVRYYERVGLVEQPPRPHTGYRRYPPEVVDRIRFIRRAQELGFSLREIRELLELRVEAGDSCGDVRDRASAKLEQIQGKIRSLERMRSSLQRLVEACGEADRARVAGCPILEALEGE